MNHHSTRPADSRTSTPTISCEVYEAAFSTTGPHPMGGVALTRTVQQARQRLADMLMFCEPTAPATADITAIHPPRHSDPHSLESPRVESYTGTAGHIFAQVNAGLPGRTVTTRPLNSATVARADGQQW